MMMEVAKITEINRRQTRTTPVHNHVHSANRNAESCSKADMDVSGTHRFRINISRVHSFTMQLIYGQPFNKQTDHCNLYKHCSDNHITFVWYK